MPLTVRNLQNSTTLFAIPGGGAIVWQAAGDTMGGDIQRVPDSLADDIDFLNSLDRGVLSVEDGSNAEVMASIERQSAGFRDSQEKARLRQEAVLDRRQDRDLVTTPCIGPNPNGRGVDECGAPVLVRSATRGEVPPLCPKHESLINEFYTVDSGSKGEGATDNTPGRVSQQWKRIAPIR